MSFGTKKVSSANTYISRDTKYYFLLCCRIMKAELYNALACLNRSFDVILESLKVLQEEGVLKADYVHDQNIIMEELRAGMNFMVVQKLNARETEDRDHFGRMRATIEAERKAEQPL